MSRTVQDSRQIIIRTFLAQLAGLTDFNATTDAKPASTTELDNLLNSINSELTPSLRMSASSTPDLVVSVGAASLVNPENSRTHTAGLVGRVLSSLASATITFPASSGGTITVTSGNNATLTVTSNNYLKFTVYIDLAGLINVLPGAENAVEANATVVPAPANTLVLGYITIFNNAGTIDNIVQSKIVQFPQGTKGTDAELSPLRMYANNPANAIINFQAYEVNRVDGTGASVPPLKSTVLAFPASTVNFQTGATTGGSFTMTFPTSTIGFFRRVGFTLLASNTIQAIFSAEAATLGAVANAGTLFIKSGIPLGWVDLEATGATAFKTAGSASNIIENAVSGVPTVHVFGSGGSGGSGTGDASAFLETLKNRLVESNYSLVTPYIVSVDEETLRDGSSTAAYSLVDSTINFTAASQTLITTQLADANEFLNTTDAISEVELMIDWMLSNIDTAATYHVSRNGGLEWQQVTMSRVGSTDVYRGNHIFEGKQTSGSLIVGDTYTIKTFVAGDNFTNVGAGSNSSGVTFIATGTTPTTWTNSSILVNSGGEAVNQDLYTQATISTNFDLNATTQVSLSQPIVVSSGVKRLLKRIDVNIEKTGLAIGNFYIQLVKDNAGNPSTALADIITESNAVSISGLSAGANVVRVNISDTYLAAGTYHIVLRTDSTYQTDYTSSAGARKISWKGNAAGSTPYARVSNAGSWSVFSTNTMGHVVKGITIDLRVKITSSTGSVPTPVKLEGLGVFYDREPIGISTSSLKQREVFSFTGASNTSSFTLTKFVPDPDLLKVYDVSTGQVYTYGAFSVNGMVVNFEAGQFLSPDNVTLVFDQTVGGSFDNSDLNGLLLASNHLGSSDGSVDRSLAGRGIMMRSPNGTLFEINVEDDGSLSSSIVS